MDDLAIGVVGVPGKWSTEVLADAIAARTGKRLVVDMGEVLLDSGSGRLIYREADLCSLDGLIVKKISDRYSPASLDRLELLRIAERAGVRVFSRPDRMLRLLDRLSCTVTLLNAGIPMPETRVTEDLDVAMETIKLFGTAVLKPLYSTKARGMHVIKWQNDSAIIKKQLQSFRAKNPMMYVQRKIALPGRDLGMVFLGGRYLGSYARVSHQDAWNTTIHSGGRYSAVSVPESTIELAHRAQALFGLDFTTVDLAETPDGPVIFEVSAFGGFRGAQEGIGINAAELYVEHVVAELRRPDG